MNENQVRALVVLATGHMVDAPERTSPRFLPIEVDRVRVEIRRHLEDWMVNGAPLTLVCGGARGADILAAEQAHELGGRVLLCLASPPHSFVESSVGGQWLTRFERLVQSERVECLVLPPEFRTTDDIYADTNTWMLEMVHNMATRSNLRLLAVWNGRSGDGPGGTADVVHRFGAGASDPRCRIVDPSAIRADGPTPL